MSSNNSQEAQSPIESTDPSLEQKVIALGSAWRRQRAAKTILPWLISLALHLGLVMLGSLITWSVVLLSDDREPVLITADFDALSFDPVAVLDAAPTISDVAHNAPSDISVELDVVPLDDPPGQHDQPLDLMPELFIGPPPVDFAPPPVQGSAEFLGVSSSNAQRIVYIIDASGGMIPYLQIVLQELARSLNGLTEQQSFAVVFFQRNEYLMVPPQRSWIPATISERQRVLSWIESNVIPAGRSNPLAAFDVALRMNPDVIFLLSDNITGSGIYEVDQQTMLDQLDKLNPVDRLTGTRRTQINCIQFLDPDPLDTLQKIAQTHGGPRSYKFLSRGELGLATRQSP